MERGELTPPVFKLYEAITAAFARQAFSEQVFAEAGSVMTMARYRESRIFLFSVPANQTQSLETFNIIKIDNDYDETETELCCTKDGDIKLSSNGHGIWLDTDQPDHVDYVNGIIDLISRVKFEH